MGGFLKVQGEKVVDRNGHPILLRGTALGGWMNMENFITGYPGHEREHRASMLKVLGQQRHDVFFDKFLEYFFTEADAQFLVSNGLNCLRLPMNYQHFEDDMNPRSLKKGCFRHLDRVVDLCSKHGIYTILDLHALPGGQNPDWHSDNITNHASFWDHRDFQDRVVWLWREIADHYKGNEMVAGYNPINEPCDSLHYRLPAFYDRLERSIREVDADHILWLDGNTWSTEWREFTHVLPNCVYALHDYSTMGFPKGETYVGSDEQKQRLENQFLRKAEFMLRHKVPIWNGEYGPVYADPLTDEGAEEVNKARINILRQQLRIYEKYNIHSTIWLYKDIGLQGMVYLNSDSIYVKRITPFLEKKRSLQLDAWGRRTTEEVDDVILPLVEWIDKNAPTSKDQYPTTWATKRQITRMINNIWLSKCLSDEFAESFAGLSADEMDECARSFHFDNCLQREALNKTLEAYAQSTNGTTSHTE